MSKLTWSNIISSLLGVYLVATVSSQSLLDSVLIILALIMLVGFRLSKIELKWIKFPNYIPLFLYGAVILVGYQVNGKFENYPWDSLNRFVWVINFYVILLVLNNIQFQLNKFVITTAVLALVPALYGLVSYYQTHDLLTGAYNTRIVGMVNSATYHAHAGGMVVVFLLGFLYLLWGKLTSKIKILSVISAVLLTVSVFLTFTRGIWVALVLSTAVIFWLESKKYFCLFIVSTALLFFTLNKYLPQFNERIQSTNISSNSERLELMKVNWQMFTDYPIFGIGYGQNLERNREYWDKPEWSKPADYITSHAHNQLLNVLSTTGLLGFIYFCWFYFYFLVKNFYLYRKYKNSKQHPKLQKLFLVLLWLQFEFLFSGLTDVTFEYAKIKATILLVWAILIVIDYQIKKEGELRLVEAQI